MKSVQPRRFVQNCTFLVISKSEYLFLIPIHREMFENVSSTVAKILKITKMKSFFNIIKCAISKTQVSPRNSVN